MLNAEKYKDELKSLNDADKLWCSAFDKHNMTFESCLNVKCENCAFNGGKGCSKERYNWLLSEYKEPVKLTRLEYEILKWLIDKDYKYIARDSGGGLYVYYEQPPKKDRIWGSAIGYHFSICDLEAISMTMI